MKELEAASCESLAEMVVVQPDAIVSRTLVKNSAGTVTLFAFDRGQELSEHSAPFDALVQVIDGEATIRIAGADHRVSAGQVILMPANVPHGVQAPVAFRMLLTMLKHKVQA